MADQLPTFKMTPKDKERFTIWLVRNKISLTQFAKNAGCSRQYLSRALNGERNVTPTVREWFKKGGYDLL